MAREERHQYKESSQAAVFCLALLAQVSGCACLYDLYATVGDGRRWQCGGRVKV
jgi:hypothetical protein